MYDTAGQEKFKSLIPMYIRDANIILAVYDITNKDMFVHTEHWVNETKDLKRDDAIFILVGNKIDLEENRVVTRKEAEDFATEQGFYFMKSQQKLGIKCRSYLLLKFFLKLQENTILEKKKKKMDKQMSKIMKMMLKELN